MKIDAEFGAEAVDRKFRVVGVESSPYTVKVRALFRYRHIPYTWLCRYPQFCEAFSNVRPSLMPVVRFPDGEMRVDSTSIILSLEKTNPDFRSISPTDPVLNFYSLLIEDMADEWLTKLVYQFRFGSPKDRRFGSSWVMDDSYSGLSDFDLSEKVDEFLQRQDGRREIVGATLENKAVLESSFSRLIQALKPMMRTDSFLFGSRPSIADFGVFAQLHTLTSDPTPSAIIRETAPRVEYWVRRAHDLSGVDGSWQQDDNPNDTVIGLLRLAGDTYLPFLKANFDAAASGAETFEVELDGRGFAQRTFRYHVKCLTTLRGAFAALSVSDQERARSRLSATGCMKYLEV